MISRLLPLVTRSALALALISPLGGCASTGDFVWIQDLAPEARASAGATVAAPGDLLSIRVWNAEQMETRQRVQEDGTVTVFFAENLNVQGLTMTQIAAAITERLDGFLVTPRVNVTMEEDASEMISVIGEVVRPGRFPVHQTPTVLAALSQAAGLTEFAKKDQIFVLRSRANTRRIRVTYDQLTNGEDAALGFELRPGDVVVVR